MQSGFIPDDATVNQLDAGKEVQSVFCDIRKAFDRVWYEGLLNKLKVAGVSGDVLRWFQSYLSGRRQRVVLLASFSEWVYIKDGLQQGSILSPLLFYCILMIFVKILYPISVYLLMILVSSS